MTGKNLTLKEKEEKRKTILFVFLLFIAFYFTPVGQNRKSAIPSIEHKWITKGEVQI